MKLLRFNFETMTYSNIFQDYCYFKILNKDDFVN